MRVFIAGFLSESNSFSPIPTTIELFKHCHFTNQMSIDDHTFWGKPLAFFAEKADQHGWECINSLCAVAMPAGPLTQTTYETIKNQLLSDLRESLPLDAIFLNLHGAMIAENCDDCEGDLLAAIREIVGDKTIISALLDPHTHLTPKMQSAANIMIWMKEYPHTDAMQRTQEIFDLVDKTLKGEIKPTYASYDCHAINIFQTTINPMRNFIDKIQQLEQDDPKILSISPIHGFPWGDTPEIGSRMYILTDDDPNYAKKISRKLGKEFEKLAYSIKLPIINQQQMLGLCQTNQNAHLKIFADYADNVGGGAPGDSTFILRELLSKNIENFALASIWDPKAVSAALSAGEGEKIKISIGGKNGSQSGAPVILEVTVKKIQKNMVIHFANQEMNFGNTVSLKIEMLKNAEIVINDNRCQTYSTECFEKTGIDLNKKSIVVVKSSEHFRDSFSKISKEIYLVATPGTLNPYLTEIKLKTLKRKVFPINIKEIIYSNRCALHQTYRLIDTTAMIKIAP